MYTRIYMLETMMKSFFKVLFEVKYKLKFTSWNFRKNDRGGEAKSKGTFLMHITRIILKTSKPVL